MLLRWGQTAFRNFRVVPPDTGIVHQVNLEYLAPVVFRCNGRGTAYPDSLVGTDSHTTMINGLGVLGWGVGGIEAEACMLGQPISMLLPPVVGFKLHGKLPEGCTATDLVLTVTQMLRKKGVVGKFVEFYGAGLSALSLADRATIANMAPEYGATMGFFPVDDGNAGVPETSATATADLVDAGGSLHQGAGPVPHRRHAGPGLCGHARARSGQRHAVHGRARSVRRTASNLPEVKKNFHDAFPGARRRARRRRSTARAPRSASGAVVIAAITSCTNTSNPSVMMAAGLLAKKAVERGLKSKPWVKTSLAPGSKVVIDYLPQGRPDCRISKR